ncbi:MAG: peroxiredoxin [Rhodospirillales bacterium]|jgi:peroxiredoxin (alkyl hydroperoxide reductase subunit C)|nr:peroxiredoxin [Rhodospirillales bacterium]
MAIQVGDRIPSVTLMRMGEKGPEAVSSDDVFKGKTVVLFGVPGAFTPTCSAKHLPGFVQHADQIKAKGVDAIVCTAVNDVFVMDAWGKDQGAGDKVMMVADGDANLTKAAGLEFDLTGKGLGLRCQRFAMVVKDGVVTQMHIDAPGKFELTSAEHTLAHL